MLPTSTFRRCLPVTLLWLLALVLPRGAYAQFSGAGAGTANDPYLIFNPAQLNQVRNYVNQSGVYFSLGADIDLSIWISTNQPSQGWVPIGTSTSPFKGTFKGNGHIIKGLQIDRSSTSYIGLFGVTSDASVTDLTVVGDVRGGGYTGILVGDATDTTVRNIHIEGSLNCATSVVGGIAGRFSGTIQNCSADVTISGRSHVGGLIGELGVSTISDCSAKADITATGDNVGGAIGFVNYQDIGTEVRSTSYDQNYPPLSNFPANPSVANYYLKGISAVGSINAQGTNIGGVIGRVYGQTKYARKETAYYNYYYHSYAGNIILEKLQASINIKGSCTQNVGGLVGCIERQTTDQDSSVQKYYEPSVIDISSSLAIGNILAKNATDVGGLVGECPTVTIDNSYFTGDIVGKKNVGGITGFGGNVTRCYANANVSGETAVAGLVGYGDASKITRSFSLCPSISASQSGVGRIYATGSVTTGDIGTTSTNYSLVESKVSANGVEQSYTTSAKNGDQSAMATMKMRATYQGLGWDFGNEWTLLETECLPYKRTQTAPPVILSKPSAGSIMVSGKCLNDGTVYMEYLGQVYTGQAKNNTWIMRTDPLKAGERLTIWTESDNLFRSYYMTYTVGYSGSGTQEDPWQIYTADDLANISGAGYYRLMNDIDLTGIDWEPIGRSAIVMTELDGDNHTISGLSINQGSTSYCGLFSAISNATIKNLVIEGADVKGGDYTGILAGSLTGCTINNVSIKGDVAGTTYTGGLAGKVSGNTTVTLCSVSGSVSGRDYTGGIVGYNASGCTISRCCTSGTVATVMDVPTYRGGGICGYTAGTISDCFTQAEVTAGYSGGIAGINYGEIARCYASGDLYAASLAAGIAGYNDGAAAVVKNCAVAMEQIKITSQTGNAMRLVGGIRNGAAMPDMATNLAFQSMILSVNGVSQEIWDDPMNGTGVTGDVLRTQSTYTKMGWLFPTIWRINGSAMPELVGLDGAGTSRTDNYMYADAQASSAGEIFELSINLRNKDIGTTFQFDMLLPDGMDIYEYYDEDEEEDVLSIEKGARLTRTHALVWKRQPNGAMRVVCTSSRLEPMIGDDGEIVRIKVKVGDNVINGRHNIRMYNVMLDSEGTSIFMNNFTIPVTILNDRVEAERVEVMRGKSVKLPVVLDNKSVITGFQFDVYLPVGARIATDMEGNPEIDLTDRCDASHVLMTKQLEDGATRVIVYAADAESKVSGNAGAIAEFNIETDVDMAEGDYDVIFKNVYLANAEFKSVECADFMSALTVTRVRRKGDVNTDGIVNSADISAGMGFLLNRGKEEWDLWAADIDDNGAVGMNDTKEITYMVLDEVIAPRVRRKAPVSGEVVSPDDPNADLDYNGTYDFYYRPFTIEPGGETMVDLCLDNPTKVSGIQWNIRLPEGMSFVYEDKEIGPDDLDPIWYEEAERSANFMLGCVAHPDQGIYSLVHLNIAAGNYKKKTGAILTFKVQADESVAPGVYTGYIENLVVMDDMDIMYRGKCEPFSIVVGDISEAEHLELNGRPDEIFAQDMAEVLAGNADLLSLDLTGVLSMPEGAAFTGGNANTVVYVDSEADRALTANTNVVVDGLCERLVLTDGHPFGVNREFTATEAVYTREMKAGEVASLYLPFKADEPVDAEYRLLEAVDFDTKNISHLSHTHSAYEACLVLSATDGVKEFRADNVIIAPEAAHEAFAAAEGGSQMFGSLTHSTVEEPVYAVEDGLLAETSKLEPFRGYISSDFETAVKEILAGGEESLEIYTVTGIRVRRDLQELQPGIYIVGGRKIMVK